MKIYADDFFEELFEIFDALEPLFGSREERERFARAFVKNRFRAWGHRRWERAVQVRIPEGGALCRELEWLHWGEKKRASFVLSLFCLYELGVFEQIER